MDSSHTKTIFLLAGLGALIAFISNVLDVVLGFGSSEVMTYGTQSAGEWFSTFEKDWFRGIYALGIFNVVYMLAMLPVYLGMVLIHFRKNGVLAILAMVLFMVAMAIYVSSNAALPMQVLSTKYTLATTEAQKNIYLSAGEAVLARGEDFTPGSFMGLFLSGIAAITLSLVILKGKVFSKVNSLVGLIGFTLLTVFTVIATFVPSLYFLAFYVCGAIGGILSLTWFLLVALKFFNLSKEQQNLS